MWELLTRIFVDIRTSVDGAALLIITWFASAGVEFSADNKAKITALAALVATSIWKLFSKDPEPRREPAA